MEDPLPIAAYQATGKDPGPAAPDVPITITVEGPAAPEDGDYILTVDAQADAYQWYVLGDGWEEAVSGAVERTFVVGAEDFDRYDLYCVCTIDGVRFGSDSAKGAAYVPEAEETLGTIPEGLPLAPDPTYSTIEMDPEKPYQGYLFAMTFADGEWVKEIRISAPQDEEAEPDKFGTFTIVDCDGGSLYDAANTLALRVIDDDAPEPSQLGFAITETEFDRSAGTAVLTVRRTGGKQDLVSVDYASEDGTAVGGRDYSPVSGTLLFYADIDEQTITIPLIDDGQESQERLTFRVTLSNVKGGADLCTLAEGKDTALVSLYNTNTAQEENLATMLHDSTAIDLSAQVTVGSGSVAPVDAAPVTGEQVETATEELEAVIGYGPEDIVPYTFHYAEPIRFSRGSISNYDSSYWKSYTKLTDNTYAGREADRVGLGSWSGSGTSVVNGGRQLAGSGPRTASLRIPNITHLYGYINAGYEFEAALASAWTLFWYGMEYVYPWSELRIAGSGTRYRVDAGVTHQQKGTDFNIQWNGSGSMSGGWNMGSSADGEMVLGLSHYDAHDSDGDAWCRLRYALLERRTFSNDLALTVYTANDADTAPADGAQLTAASGVYNAMRPRVTIVPQKGGVNRWGELYVGSQLKIELASTASYFPAQTSAGASRDFSISLTDSKGKEVKLAEKGSDGAYYLTLDWPGLNEDGLRDQYTLHIAMTRKQSVKLDVTPSTDRLVDGNGNTLSSADPAKFSQAWARFNASGGGAITIGYSDTSTEKPYFKSGGTKTLTVTGSAAATTAWKNLENIQWVEFGRSPEDRIVLNGRTYAGNERIWLTTADLSASELVFYYYHKDYLTSESVMVPSVDHIGLYLDGNGNGRIDGWFDRETGYFMLDEDSGDVFLSFLEDGVDYDESLFAPVVNKDGKYCQYFLKVFYTKLPRCLVPPAGQEAQRAQILPAFISNVTDAGNLAALTKEQQSYRYIIAGQSRAYAGQAADRSDTDYACSADGLPMYGAEATRMEMLDIPLGGDVRPAQMTADKKGCDWTPGYRGNLLIAFSDPEPIFIAHSLAGDNIPVARIKEVDADGTIRYEEGGAEKLNGYLGSFVGNSAVVLCAQEQTETTAQIAAVHGGSAWEGVLENRARTFAARDDAGGKLDLEAVTIGGVGTFPDSSYIKQNQGQAPDTASIDMEDSGNSFPEFDLDLGVKLPSTDIGITDFVSIIMDGYEVGFSIGADLGGYNSDDGLFGPQKVWENTKEDMGKLKDFLATPHKKGHEKDRYAAADDSFKDATNGKTSSMGFEVSFSVTIAFLFKYDPVDNTYYFSQFSVAAAAGLEFSYQHRLTPAPCVYLYITAGAGIEIGTGATVERQTVTETLDLPEGADSLQKGQSIHFGTDCKAFDIEFKGQLLVELFEDEACQRPVGSIDGAPFNLGYIKSDGGDPVTVTLAKRDGYQLDKTYHVRLTALDSTSISGLEKVTHMETISYWSGFQISPEVFAEAGAGVGIEILKFEAFIKVSVGCSLTLGAYDTDKNEYEGFSFDEFDLALGLGLRVVLLVFSYEMDMISYHVSYDKDGDRWIHRWEALGGLFGEEIGTVSVTDSSGQTYGVRVRLPGSAAHTQEIYSNEDSGISTFAFDPTDKDNVPFQLSGYGSSGDAFKLADGLALGYGYQVVSVNGQNYVVYTISREGDDLHPVDYTMLVLSRLRLTNENGKDVYGLVNPVDAEDGTPYILLDTKDGADDGTGDLDFHVWVDGTTIHAVWVSYASPGDLGAVDEEPTEEKPALSDGTEMGDYNSAVQTIAANAAKNTVVKTASFDTAVPDTGFSAAQNISGAVGSHVFLPNIADRSVVVYGKAEHFITTELTTKEQAYAAYLNKAYPGTDDAMQAIRDYRLTYQKGLWDAYGKRSDLCVSVNGTLAETALAEGQILENIEAAKIGDTYYAAYTTGEQTYEDGDLVNIRRLYLRTFTVSGTTVTWGDPLLLRTLCDYDRDSKKDGLYAGAAQTAPYADPYFAGLQFLYGKLGGIQGTDESFTARAMAADQPEHFLLFEMNGSTYVIPQSSLESITTSHTGQIIPFFTPPEDAGKNEKISASTGRAEVTIGADGAGNIAAVYTGTVANTTNNAIYLTKWDPNSQTWGTGIMLAMHYMQVYEDAAEQGWSAEETEAAYLGKRPGYTGGGMEQFTFSDLQIALGQTDTRTAASSPDGTGSDEGIKTAAALAAGSGNGPDGAETPISREIADSTDSSRDTLLVLTQGSMRYLEDRTVPDKEETVLAPMSDSKALAQYEQNGGHKPGVGVYAISYGVGGQSIGQSSLTFQDYDFSAGSQLTAYLSFVNTGDVAIRASEQNPAVVELKLYVPAAAENTGSTSTLATWNLTENLRSGQKAVLDGSCAALTRDLPNGSIFYIEVREDADYIASTGGAAFEASTLVVDENGTPTGGDLVVEPKPDLALEDLHITSVNADSNGNTILQVEFLAANRGSVTAEGVFAKFRYEDGDGSYQPLDISNSDLNISAPAQIAPFSLRDADPRTQGILYLHSGEVDDDGSLPAGMYRKVSGTITVPPSVYQGKLTGSLNLHIELFSNADPQINTHDTAAYHAEHGEYNSANNAAGEQIEHKTFFTAADQVILALGTTVRLPVSYTTTTGYAPQYPGGGSPRCGRRWRTAGHPLL